MTTNQVPWSSAYYALIPIAINTMLSPREPISKTCTFDPSLRLYLRSSPIISSTDALFILIRFLIYSRSHLHHHQEHQHLRLRKSWPRIAREIRALRGLKNEIVENTEPNSSRESLWKQELNTYLLYIGIGFGVITQLLKLSSFSGGGGAIPWTQAWAGMYFTSWLITEITYQLAKLDHGEEVNLAQVENRDRWVARWEQAFGILAILVQVGILAAVDMKAIPPDPIIPRRWQFRGLRFLAHCAVCVVHLPFLFISWEIDARRPLAPKYMGVLLLSIIVPHIISAGTQERRFSALYFMVSVMISYFAWLMYFFPWTKKWVLFCEKRGAIQPGELAQGGNGQPQINLPMNGAEAEEKGWQNVLAFDFFLRIVVFSAYWYVVHYDPTGTSQPQWTSYLP